MDILCLVMGSIKTNIGENYEENNVKVLVMIDRYQDGFILCTHVVLKCTDNV